MALSNTFEGSVTIQDQTDIKNEINRLRVKHSLSSYSFSTLSNNISSEKTKELRDQIKGLESSQWIGTIDVSTIAPIDIVDIVRQANFTTMKTKLTEIDAICTNNSNYSDNSNNSNYGVDHSDNSPLCSAYSNNSDLNQNTNDSYNGQHPTDHYVN